MKVLFATNNPAKIKYYAEELENRKIKLITINDLKEKIEVEETGKNAIENSILKAKAYYELSGLTTIGVDDCLYFEGLEEEKQPGCNVRRVNGKRLEDKEMLQYYTDLIGNLGGQIKGYWVHGIAVCKEGEISTYEKKTEMIFTDQISPIVSDGYPLDSISLVPKYQKYRSELNKEEIEEQQTQKSKALFEFIEKHI